MDRRATESQRLHDLLFPLVVSPEAIVAEGRAQTDEMRNRAFLIVTDKRILWRDVGASRMPNHHPLRELRFESVERVRERHDRGRSHIEIVVDGRREVFEFNRSDAAAANAIRHRLAELHKSYEVVKDFGRHRRRWWRR